MSTTNRILQVEDRNPKTFKPHPMNPKVHTDEQINHITESIRRFKFTQPVVVDEDSTILIGHARTKAAIKLGLKKVPTVVMSGLKEHEKLALCLADNQLAQQTPIDTLKVEAIAAELKKKGYSFDELGIQAEYAEPEMADQGEADQGVIKQVVIVFEAADFDTVIKKFDAIRAREPKLQDNTEVFTRLLDIFETAMR